MHPLKPYFLGHEAPPHHRLTTLPEVLPHARHRRASASTTRHLTFFEMLGNFSIGDYFKQGAVEFAWELSLEGFGFDAERIWITVFEGDEELGLGPDEEAIEAWVSVGVPRERIVAAAAVGELLAGRADRPVRPVLGALLRPRARVRQAPTTSRAATTSASSSTGTSSSCSSTRTRVNDLTPLPAQNIDTGLGLNRLAAILQDKPIVFETDQFAPLIELGRGAERRATARRSTPTARCASSPTTRAGCRSWSPTASCPPTRTAATCCAG